MNFNRHSDLAGKHAFLSASKYHWVNYSEEKLVETYLNAKAKERGSALHQLAHDLIVLGVKLPKNKETLNEYVNDAIGFKMASEQVLFYSYISFGTADAISFRKNFLRIHDLKTGDSPAEMIQLEIYAALFCLEYNTKPEEIEIELRIYQSDLVDVERPIPERIRDIMNTIIKFNKRIEKLQLEV